MINFSGTENISNLIDLEKVSLLCTLDIQKNFNKQILIFVKKFMTNIDLSCDSDPNNKASIYLNESTNCLNMSNSNISVLKNLLDSLEKIDSSNIEELKNYNINFKECMNTIYTNTEKIENFIQKITLTDFSELPNTSSEVIAIDNEQLSVTPNTESSPYTENTLVISESQKKIIFPYTLNKLEDILQNNARYHSIDEIINRFYTKPINYYKFSPIARFKEAYKLVKEKERGSTFKALSLAFELFGNYNLHPAIITACKSIDELDIYLAC